MMKPYKKMLCVMSLTSPDAVADNDAVFETTKDLSNQTGADVEILGMIPVIGKGIDYSLPSLRPFEQAYTAEFKRSLQKAANEHGIFDSNPIVSLGNHTDVVRDAISQLDIDLIVVKNDNERSLSKAQELMRTLNRDMLFVKCD
jgi:nucleotide-binding universal stress UspA family protein